MAKSANAFPGRTKATALKRKAFLVALTKSKSVTAACHKSGWARQVAYDHRAADQIFAKAWDDAYEQGTDMLEDVATERAVKTSDTMLIFTLKARRPEKYRERFEHTGPNGTALIPDRNDTEIAHAVAALLAGAIGRITINQIPPPAPFDKRSGEGDDD